MASSKNKTTIFFAHSAGPQYGPGKGSYDLVKYLRAKLQWEFQVVFPMIEKPNAPTYAKYKAMYRSAFSAIKGPLILVGHSLGASTLLQYLSEEKPKISVLGLYLIATPHWDSSMKTFQLKKDFQRSINQIPTIHLYHSQHDTVVPFDHLAFYKNAFTSPIVHVIRGKEHIFSKGLPALVKDIEALVR